MKNLKLFAITLLFSLMYANAANILPITETEQQKDQWCWAGCSTPILNYYGENLTQGEIVQYAYGDSAINQWNWLSGNASVDYQGTTYNPHGINQILDNWNTDNEYGVYTLSENEWKAEIDSGHPFVVRWGWSAGGGHFVVGQGYLDNGNYQIMDPWFGAGYTINTYSWILNAQNKGNWTHSLTTNRNVPVATFTLTVEGGTGSGKYAEGEVVPVVADSAISGSQFLAWTGDIGSLNDVGLFSAEITMPDSNITITSSYQMDVSLLSSNVTSSSLGFTLNGSSLLMLSNFIAGEYNISFYSLSGRKINEIKKEFKIGENIISLNNLHIGSQTMVIKIEGEGIVLNKVFLLVE